MKTEPSFDGPIPGENFTSDTKNYPWHRTPDHSTIDGAMDSIIQSLRKPRASHALMQMLEIGLSVADVTNIFLLKGVERGKWPIDLAILMAGPVSHLIVIMAKTYDISYKLGVDDGFKGPSAPMFNKLKSKINTPSKSDKKQMEFEQEEVVSGFLQGM